MVVSAFPVGSLILSLFLCRYSVLYLRGRSLTSYVKSIFEDQESPTTYITPLGSLPWKNEGSFQITIELEDETICFEYKSTAEALDKLSNRYIQPGEDLSIPVESSTCPICDKTMNPLSGAEGLRSKPIGVIFRDEEPVNICISCSKDVRRTMVRRGTPNHSTSEILANNWNELEADVDFL